MMHSRGELRNWVEIDGAKQSFQGYSHGDPNHMSPDGKFITIEADKVSRGDSGLIVWQGNWAWWLWDKDKKKSPKDTKDMFK